MELIIKAIKYFLVEGAVKFYVSYYRYGEGFFMNVEIDEEKLSQIQKEAEVVNHNASKDEKKQYLNEFEKRITQEILIRDLQNFDELSIEEQNECAFYYKYVLQIIIGNITGMLEAIREDAETGKISRKTSKELEDYFYINFARMQLNLLKIIDAT